MASAGLFGVGVGVIGGCKQFFEGFGVIDAGARGIGKFEDFHVDGIVEHWDLGIEVADIKPPIASFQCNLRKNGEKKAKNKEKMNVLLGKVNKNFQIGK